MLRFVLGRLAVLIPTFIGVSIIAFSFIRLLPGDPVMLMSGERVMDPGALREDHRTQLGYDRPMIVQYLDYLGGLVTGDFGNSIVTKRPVLQDFFTLFPATLELSLCAILFAVMLGIPAGDHRGGEARLVLRPGDHGRRARSAIRCRSSGGGCCSSSSSPACCGWTPVSGRISLMYFFPSVTGFMLIDSLLSGQAGAFRSALSHLILPDDRARHHPARRDRAADALRDAGGARRGLRADGARQGPAAAARRRAARAPERADPRHHHDRPAGRRADGRRHPDRDDLFLAGDRQVDGRFRLRSATTRSSRAGS